MTRNLVLAGVLVTLIASTSQTKGALVIGNISKASAVASSSSLVSEVGWSKNTSDAKFSIADSNLKPSQSPKSSLYSNEKVSETGSVLGSDTQLNSINILPKATRIPEASMAFFGAGAILMVLRFGWQPLLQRKIS